MAQTSRLFQQPVRLMTRSITSSVTRTQTPTRHRGIAKTLPLSLHHQLFSSSRSLSTKPEVTLTSERYPSVRRGSFGRLEDADVAFFRRLLPDGERVITDETALEGVNVDWLRMVRGQSKLLLKPRTTDEVAAILR